MSHSSQWLVTYTTQLLRDRDVDDSWLLRLWWVVHVYVMRHGVSLLRECDEIIPTWCIVMSRRVHNVMSRTHGDMTHSQGDMTHYYTSTMHALGTIRCVLGSQSQCVCVSHINLEWHTLYHQRTVTWLTPNVIRLITTWHDDHIRNDALCFRSKEWQCVCKNQIKSE